MRLTARAVRTTAAIAVTCAAALVPAAALAAPGNPATPVPPVFRANSVTFLTAQRGWVLGAVPCGKSTCADLAGTTDGGTTWSQTGQLKEPIAIIGKGVPGVTEVRFATPGTGWAFGPLLLRTSNGGKSWARQAIPGGGKQILSLASSASQTYAVVSDCAWGGGLCAQPLSFWRIATKPGSTWTRVPLNLPVNVSADVAVRGTTVYVVDEQLEHGKPDKLYASTDGVHFAARAAPCSHAKDLALLQAVPMSATRVALLCDGNPGFSKAVKTVYVSADTGKTDTFAGAMGLFGIQAELAASPSGNLAVASSSDGSFMYINDSHKRAWTRVIGSGDGGAGWNDITYVTNTRAWVVYGPADFSDIGVLYVTRDAGHHWNPVKL
jgi:photosystem II stability/assembly factor-like uncharacterized protein